MVSPVREWIAASLCAAVGVASFACARRLQAATIALARRSPHLFPFGTAPQLRPYFVWAHRVGGVLFILVALAILWFARVR